MPPGDTREAADEWRARAVTINARPLEQDLEIFQGIQRMRSFKDEYLDNLVQI